MTVRQAIREALRLLSRRDRRLLLVSVLIQMATSLLDLVGVLLIGLVGALAVTTMQSQPIPQPITIAAEWLGMGNANSEQLIVVFSSIAAIVLLVKSFVSSYLTRRVFIFLANRQAMVSGRLARGLLAESLVFLQSRSSQETAWALIQGTSAATLQILGQSVIALTELALLVVVGGALLFIDPLTTIAAILFFSFIGLLLQRAMGSWAGRLGQGVSRADIDSLNAIQEALGMYREIYVTDRREFYAERIQELRWRSARMAADSTVLTMLPKYIFEAALVVGGFALAGFLFATEGASQAVGTLALFLAAGSRVMPSLLRLQGATLQLRGAAGVAGPTFELAASLAARKGLPLAHSDSAARSRYVDQSSQGFRPSVQIQDVSFTYPDASRPALSEVSLSIEAGQSLALVGRSGSGKSTLADLMLGILVPDSGTALVGGLAPRDAIIQWAGGIAYVPQEVVLANDSIRANVALGLPADLIDDDRVIEALDRAHLGDYLVKSREGLSTYIGEGGLRLSGGQRQRLGVARALYTQPRLLVLDEATSALDAETEASIGLMIEHLGSGITKVIIAHRLSTVRHADTVAYLEEGCLVAVGTFEDVRSSAPGFARQADLLGL